MKIKAHKDSFQNTILYDTEKMEINMFTKNIVSQNDSIFYKNDEI